MAIWDKLLSQAISPVIDKKIKQLNQENDLQKGTLPVQVNGGAFTPYPVGIGPGGKDKIFSRGVNYQTLRDFSLYYPILRACIDYRKRQITQLEWNISPKKVITDKKIKAQHQDDADTVKEFFAHPTGEKHETLRHFLNKVLEDLVVLDAVAIYKRRNRKGGIYGYIPVDGSSIEMALHTDGTTPVPPQPAYIQKIHGIVVAELTTDEMIYRMMNPRTNSPYGLSPVEALILTVTTALRLGAYNLNYLTEGNVPEGFVELPKEVAGNADQLKHWQEAWDAMFSGDPRFQRKVKFLPEGMKWHPVKKAEDLEFEKFDKWLLLQTCSVMEVSPQSIGFQFERGKGATEMEWEIGKERGMYPLAHFLKEVFDQVIQEDLGMGHLEFVWSNINPTNKVEEAKIFDTLVKSGAVSVDEWRLGEGMDPIGLAHYIMSPVGPVLVSDLIKASKEGFNTATNPFDGPNQQGKGDPNTTIQGKAPQDGGTGDGSNKPKGDAKTDTKTDTKTNTKDDAKKLMEKAVVAEELKRWKKCAAKDYKIGKGIRDFKTDIIDERTQALIKDGLKTLQKKEDIDALFNPLIGTDSQVIAALLDLYEDIARITKGESYEPAATDSYTTAS